MKNVVALFTLACLTFACEKKAAEVAVPTPDPVTLPMEVSYKGTPAVGNMKNVQVVMECNKRLSELNPDIAGLLADSVTLHFADGTDITGTRDSVLVFFKKLIENFSSIKINFTAAIPIDNVDAKDEWVFSWTDETYTHKDGKVEHQLFHEDYRLEDGKIREVFQYARKPPAEPAK